MTEKKNNKPLSKALQTKRFGNGQNISRKVEMKQDPITGRMVRYGRYRKTVRRNILLEMKADDVILQYQADHGDEEGMSYTRAINQVILGYEKLREKKENEIHYNAKLICEELDGELVEREDGVMVCHFKRYNHGEIENMVKVAEELMFSDIKDQYYPNRQTVEQIWEDKRQ